MSDYSELKRLASAAKNWGGEIGEHRWYEAGCFKQPGFSVPDAEFLAGCEPGAVLALIAERDMFKAVSDAFLEKTEWVQQTGEALELGMHRADVLKGRIDQLKAEVEALRTALCKIMTQIDGNIRVTVRDCVNGHDDVQDIYEYCDAIKSLVDAAMGKEAGHD